MKLGYIYILKDPDTNLVRYVGQTICKPERRYAQHIYQWKRTKGRITHVNSWIKSLSFLNKLPLLEIIDTVSITELDQKEIDYIKLYKAVGANLTNHSLGGAPNRGCKMPKESIQKRLDTCKISKAWQDKGAIHSEIMKAKHAAGLINFGYKHLDKEKRIEIGKKHSLLMIEKFKENKTLNRNMIIKILKPIIAITEKQEILEFESASEAARFFKIKDSTHIIRVCKKKSKSNKTHGIYFEYKYDSKKK